MDLKASVISKSKGITSVRDLPILAISLHPLPLGRLPKNLAYGIIDHPDLRRSIAGDQSDRYSISILPFTKCKGTVQRVNAPKVFLLEPGAIVLALFGKESQVVLIYAWSENFKNCILGFTVH